MIVTTSWISENYSKFNNLCFDGTLPTIKFKVNRSKTCWGFASFRYDFENNIIIPESITISNYYDSPEEVKIQTLLHEMIHIKDYLSHPEHFVRNHRKVSGRTYNPHGEWFSEEANRISNESGYKIATHVTKEEFEASTLSIHSKNIQNNKKNNALICAVIGSTGIWYFKTDVHKVDYLKKTLRTSYNWSLTIGEFKMIKFYTFDNPALASRRSCCSRIRGWKTDKFGFMNKMKDIKATEVTHKF